MVIMDSFFNLEQPCEDVGPIEEKRPLYPLQHPEGAEGMRTSPKFPSSNSPSSIFPSLNYSFSFSSRKFSSKKVSSENFPSALPAYWATSDSFFYPEATSLASQQKDDDFYVCLWPDCKVSTAQLSQLNEHYAGSHLWSVSSTSLGPSTVTEFRRPGDSMNDHLMRSKHHIKEEQPTQSAWMIIDKSLDRSIVSTCSDCFSHKLYGSAEEARAHLRENHIEIPTKKRKRLDQDRRADVVLVGDSIENWITEIPTNIYIKGEEDVLPNKLPSPGSLQCFTTEKPFLESKSDGWCEDSNSRIVPASGALEHSIVVPDPQTVLPPRSWLPRDNSRLSFMLRHFTPSSEDSYPQDFNVKNKRQCLLITPDDTDTDSVQALESESLEPKITFLEDNEMEHNPLDFLALPVGHPMLKKWVEVLPSVRGAIKDILGIGNKGSVDFCSFRGEPTVCFTCRKPNKVRVKLLKTHLAACGLPAVIVKSSNKRSMWPNNCEDPRRTWSVPAVSARLNRRVHCGSSLGIALDPFQDHKVSLGGYLKLLHSDKDYWTLYAVTVHHAIEPPENDSDGESVTSKDDDSQPSTYSNFDVSGEDHSEGGSGSSRPSQSNTARIINGALQGVSGDLNFSSPAKLDFDHAMQRRNHLQHLCRLRPDLGRIFNQGILPEQRPISEVDTAFGKAIWSSGLCKDNGSEMDWLLIGELRTSRVGCNSISERPGFVEGNGTTTNGQNVNEPLPTEYVDEIAFESLMAAVEDSEFCQHNPEYRFHIKGHGSESGLKDGFLNPAVGIEFDGEDSSYRHSFHPRDRPGLGQPGDSGTWIFLENGMLLGQIHSYNRVLDLAYFTPIYKIFDHIKKITGSKEIKLPDESDHVFFGFDSTDYGYCSPGDVEGSPAALKPGQKGISAALGIATPRFQVSSPGVWDSKHLSP